MQPWFQNFAGVAFRWQDAGPTDSMGSGSHTRLFAVVPTQTKESDSTGRPVHPVGGERAGNPRKSPSGAATRARDVNGFVKTTPP